MLEQRRVDIEYPARLDGRRRAREHPLRLDDFSRHEPFRWLAVEGGRGEQEQLAIARGAVLSPLVLLRDVGQESREQ